MTAFAPTRLTQAGIKAMPTQPDTRAKRSRWNKTHGGEEPERSRMPLAEALELLEPFSGSTEAIDECRKLAKAFAYVATHFWPQRSVKDLSTAELRFLLDKARGGRLSELILQSVRGRRLRRICMALEGAGVAFERAEELTSEMANHVVYASQDLGNEIVRGRGLAGDLSARLASVSVLRRVRNTMLRELQEFQSVPGPLGLACQPR